MDDLATWLQSALDDEERAARAVQEGFASYDSAGRPTYSDIDGMADREVAHIARWDPARVLAEVDAKRRILARHGPIEVFGSLYCTHCGVLGGQRARNVNWPCPEVRDAAAPYADRPGYRDEWKP